MPTSCRLRNPAELDSQQAAQLELLPSLAGSPGSEESQRNARAVSEQPYSPRLGFLRRACRLALDRLEEHLTTQSYLRSQPVATHVSNLKIHVRPPSHRNRIVFADESISFCVVKEYTGLMLENKLWCLKDEPEKL